jgi:hypothetical protein
MLSLYKYNTYKNMNAHGMHSSKAVCSGNNPSFAQLMPCGHL